MIARNLWFDIETFNETPIKHGTHRYAETVELLLLQYAIDEGPVRVVDVANGEQIPDEFWAAWDDPDTLIWAHKSDFDRTMMRFLFPSRVPAIERWRDTLVQALCHGLPGGLDKLSVIFRLPESKAKMRGGKDHIKLFCKPMPKNAKIRRATAKTHPTQWREFKLYGGNDIEAMRELHKRMPKWNYPDGIELARWHLDQKINDRGLPIDVEFVEAAIAAATKEKARLNARMKRLTADEVERATQRDRLLAHLLKEYGVTLPDMTATTLETRINDPELPGPVKELLEIRLAASSASVSKYLSLFNAISSDGRLRGSLQFSGAQRTGRWAGRIFQPQNLPRYILEHIAIYFDLPHAGAVKEEHVIRYLEDGISAVKAGVADILFHDVMYLMVNLVRSVMKARPGYKLIVPDQSNIEGRVAAWIAGEEWKLEAFRAFDRGEGPDLYLVTAGGILGKPPEAVTKDERQTTGKVPELACGYQGSIGAFQSMARLYGLNLPDSKVFQIVRGWREKNAMIASMWPECEQAAKIAILCPGKRVQCRRIWFERRGAWLVMGLPSGRLLCYASPKIENDKITFMGVDPYTKQWRRQSTYGGKVFENAVQGTAAEIIKDNITDLESAGYEVVLSVHDETPVEVPDLDEFNAAEVNEIMMRNRPWMAGLPLLVKAGEMYTYRKE